MGVVIEAQRGEGRELVTYLSHVENRGRVNVVVNQLLVRRARVVRRLDCDNAILGPRDVLHRRLCKQVNQSHGRVLWCASVTGEV